MIPNSLRGNPTASFQAAIGCGLVVLLAVGLGIMRLTQVGPFYPNPASLAAATLTPTPEHSPGVLSPLQAPITSSNANQVSLLTRWGAGSISGLKWSPDQHTIAAVAGDGIYLYDSQTLTQVRFIQVGQQISSIAFSHDGKSIAVGGHSRGVDIRLVSDGSVRQTLAEPNEVYFNPSVLAFSPDGKLLATGTSWMTEINKNLTGHEAIRVWRLSDASIVQSIVPNNKAFGDLRSVAFSPDGALVTSVDRFGRVQVWRVSDGQLVNELKVMDSRWGTASPDGELVMIIGLSGGDIQILRKDGSLLHAWKPNESIGDAEFSPDSAFLATHGSYSTKVTLWRVSDGTLVGELTWNGLYAQDAYIAFSPDGQLIAEGSGQIIRVWRVSDRSLVSESPEHTGPIWSLALSQDGNLLASGSADHTLRIWRLSDGRLVQKLEQHHEVLHAVFSPDSNLVAVGNRDNRVGLWDIRDGKQVEEWQGAVAAFSPNGLLLAIADNALIQIWRFEDSTLVGEMKGHTAPVNTLAFSPDGMFLASGSDDQTVRLWRVSDQSVLHVLKGHADWVWSVAFNPAGTLLASASQDGSIRIWRVSNGTLERVQGGDKGPITNTAFNFDGTVIATAERHCDCVRLWRVSDGSLLKELIPTGHAWSLAFRPDSNLLVTGSNDGTLALWGLRTSP